eukprot:751038-Hanusia_phi.AAC.4
MHLFRDATLGPPTWICSTLVRPAGRGAERRKWYDIGSERGGTRERDEAKKQRRDGKNEHKKTKIRSPHSSSLSWVFNSLISGTCEQAEDEQEFRATARNTHAVLLRIHPHLKDGGERLGLGRERRKMGDVEL